MYFGYSLNNGMLKALQLLPFLLILSCFIQITMYDLIQFHSFKHWNLNAVTITLPPQQTQTLTTLNFFCMPILAMLQVSLHGFYVLLLSEKEWRKRIKSQSGHYVTTSIFQDAVLRKSSWAQISAGTASWDSCLTEEEELQKAHTTGSQALQRALEAGKYQTTTYSKPNNNSGSFWHLLTLEMYLQPTPGVKRDNKPV